MCLGGKKLIEAMQREEIIAAEIMLSVCSYASCLSLPDLSFIFIPWPPLHIMDNLIQLIMGYII